MINGPRQSGKSTLIKQIAMQDRKYITLDDVNLLDIARNDPIGLIRHANLLAIDEIQRAPELLLAIKKSVDEDRRPGRFLLIGSANIMTMPKVSESLAGRMETLHLLPLASSEIYFGKGQWLDFLFKGEVAKLVSSPKGIAFELDKQLVTGGYPEAIARKKSERRETWFMQYLEALIARDFQENDQIHKIEVVEKLLKILAQMSGQLCNTTAIGSAIGIDGKTANKYISILERMFLVRRVSQWSANNYSRVIKMPKIFFLDSGLQCSLMRINEDNLDQERKKMAHILETYVFSELLKLISWAHKSYAIYTYRDKDQIEVDFIIEDNRNRIIGVEVKKSATVRADDFKGLKKVEKMAEESFVLGIVLYDGNEVLPISKKMWAIPISSIYV
jgi:predicted AAA+ superfamily ATPase